MQHLRYLSLCASLSRQSSLVSDVQYARTDSHCMFYTKHILKSFVFQNIPKTWLTSVCLISIVFCGLDPPLERSVIDTWWTSVVITVFIPLTQKVSYAKQHIHTKYIVHIYIINSITGNYTGNHFECESLVSPTAAFSKATESNSFSCSSSGGPSSSLWIVQSNVTPVSSPHSDSASSTPEKTLARGTLWRQLCIHWPLQTGGLHRSRESGNRGGKRYSAL